MYVCMCGRLQMEVELRRSRAAHQLALSDADRLSASNKMLSDRLESAERRLKEISEAPSAFYFTVCKRAVVGAKFVRVVTMKEAGEGGTSRSFDAILIVSNELQGVKVSLVCL